MSQLETSAVPVGFTEASARANGITINYVRGGSGPTLVLLHGYPQTWYMWRKVMPTLSEHYTVIAPDLRGSGGSDAPEEGYDKATLAEDVHQLLAGLGLAGQVNIVGHDIGTLVSFAYAADHPGSTRRLVLMEAPLFDEGLYQLPAITPDGPGLWNIGFFALENGLPEQVVAGREDTWVKGFIDWMEQVKGAVGEQAVHEYAAHLRRPGHIRATFEYFRTFQADVSDTTRHRSTLLTMPVLAVGAEAVMGRAVHDQVVSYAKDVTGEVVPSGHWIAEEIPGHLTERLLAFLR
jgi:pimeloyl-ACP methyl ester carboxylesterase